MVIGASVAVIAIGVYSIAEGGADDVAPGSVSCANDRSRAQAVWNDVTKLRMQAAFAATGRSYSDRAAEGAAAALDLAVEGWLTARAETCAEDQASATRGAEQVVARARCLDDQFEHVRAHVALLVSADGGVMDNALTATTALGEQSCRHPDPAPASESAERQLLHKQLASAVALDRLGRVDDAQARIGAVVAAAATADRALHARALLVAGQIAGHQSEFERAERLLSEAAATAAGCDCAAIQASAWTELVWVTGYERYALEAGLVWADMAEDAIRRAEGDAAMLAHLLARKGRMLWLHSRHLEAMDVLAEAIVMRRELYRADDIRVAVPLDTLGLAETYLGRLDDALAHYSEAVEIRRKQFGEEHPAVAESLHGVGMVHQHAGRYVEAEAAFVRAKTLREKALGADHPVLTNSLVSLGHVAVERELFTVAERYYTQALAARQKEHAQDHPKVGEVLNDLGTLYLRQGELDKAEEYFQRALEVWSVSIGEHSPTYAIALSNLAHVAINDGDTELARDYFTRTLEIERAGFGDQHSSVAGTLNNLGAVAELDQFNSVALGHYTEAADIWQATLGPSHPDTLGAMASVARMRLATGSADGVVKLATRVLKRSKDPYLVAQARFTIARAVKMQGGDAVRVAGLAEEARLAFEALGEQGRDDLEVVDAFMASAQ